jgi:hypothetical protein
MSDMEYPTMVQRLPPVPLCVRYSLTAGHVDGMEEEEMAFYVAAGFETVGETLIEGWGMAALRSWQYVSFGRSP